MKWISIKDSLPCDLQPIIFYVDILKSKNEKEKLIQKCIGTKLSFVGFGIAHLSKCESGDFLSYVSMDKSHCYYPIHNAKDDFITHWMPLPEQPKS